MQAYRAEATLTDAGKITLGELPFTKGQRVEVIVLATDDDVAGSSGHPVASQAIEQASRVGTSMKGDPSLGPVVLNYDPTEPATEEEWPLDAR